jgi:hypothetical protein
MKKTIGIVAGFVLSILSLSVNAQDTTVKSNTWDAKKNPTVEAITSPYKDKLIPEKTQLTTEQIFPVIGTYQSTTNAETPTLTISLDADNKGLVWIQGLPQGKVKAMLRQSPATYKIPAQKTEEGKDVAEGTLIFDKEANTLTICIGKAYNAADPASVFVPAVDMAETNATVKTKTAKVKTETKVKPWMYTGTKVEKATALN